MAIPVALAIEIKNKIEFSYATDRSADKTEARGEGKRRVKAAAWRSWDGSSARGGALPPRDTINQIQ